MQRLWAVLGRGILALTFVSVFAFFVVSIGVVRDYQTLIADRVPVPPVGDLRAAFDALPSPDATSTDVYLLDDPVLAWTTRWRMITEARRTIDVAYFILDQDVFGVAFLGALLDRADHGLQVRILLDGLGTDMSRNLIGDDLLEELGSHPNVEVRLFRPMIQRLRDLTLTWRITELVASQHDKIIVVDGQWALTGGRNIAAAYFTPPGREGRQFVDYDVLLHSQVTAYSLQRAFERIHQVAAGRAERANIIPRQAALKAAFHRMDAWLRGQELPLSDVTTVRELDIQWRARLWEHPELRNALHALSAPRAQRAETRIVDTVARREPMASEITRTFLTLLQTAEQDVLIVNPYLALDESAVRAMEHAARRGVRITLLTNSPWSSDNDLTQGVFTEQWPTILARVPTARLFVLGGHDTLHAKLAAFDDHLSLLGTYNLDPTAMRMNSELMVGIWSTSINAELREFARTRIDAGPPITYEYMIARDVNGTPLRQPNGDPIICFGPDHHLSHHQRAAADRYRRWLAPLRRFLELEPMVKPL